MEIQRAWIFSTSTDMEFQGAWMFIWHGISAGMEIQLVWDFSGQGNSGGVDSQLAWDFQQWVLCFSGRDSSTLLHQSLGCSQRPSSSSSFNLVVCE